MSSQGLTRRTFLGAAATTLVGRRAAAESHALMPVGYVAHGSPRLATDPVRGPELRRWGASLPRPTGIVTLTPHWRARGLRIGHQGVGHALASFPAGLARDLPKGLDYRSPDNRALARVVADLLAPLEPAFDEARAGFDHTVWMPLMHLFPDAPAPVVELAMPFMTDTALVTLGKRLAPLRREGVFLLVSGNLTHNLAATDMTTAAPEFAEFDAWTAAALEKGDVASLLDWRNRAPRPELVHPDDGAHFRVLLVALGAVLQGEHIERVRFPVVGFEAPTLSKRCVELA